MFTYAIIESNKVINTITATQAFVDSNYPDAIRIDNLSPIPSIGWDYDNGNFSNPVTYIEPSAPAPTYIVSRYDFRMRFTFEELVAIDNFSINPSLTSLQKMQVNTVIQTYAATPQVNLLSATTQIGLAVLVSCGLLTSDRATAIATP